jgi:DNA-binding transcriptional LysR family regulator
VAVFDELRQGVDRIDFISDPATGELRIGSTSALMTGYIPAVIDRLTREPPRIVVHALQGSDAELMEQLRERKIDLVVGRTWIHADQGLSIDELFNERVLVVASVENPLSRRRAIKLAELIDEPWILLPDDHPAATLLADAFRKCGLALPRRIVVSESGPLRNGLLATGRFLTVAARSALYFTAKRLAIKALPVVLPTRPDPVGVMRLRNRTIPAVAQSFIDHARSVAKAI